MTDEDIEGTLRRLEELMERLEDLTDQVDKIKILIEGKTKDDSV